MSISYELGQRAALVKLGYIDPGDVYSTMDENELSQNGDSTVGHLKSMGLGGLGGGALGYGAGHLMGNGPKGALIGALGGALAGGVAKNIKNRGVRDELGPQVAPFDAQLRDIQGRRNTDMEPHQQGLNEVDDALWDMDNPDDQDDFYHAQRPSHVRPAHRDLWLKDQDLQAKVKPIHAKYDAEEKPVNEGRQQAYKPFGDKLRRAF